MDGSYESLEQGGLKQSKHELVRKALANAAPICRDWNLATVSAYKSLGNDFRWFKWRQHRLWPLIFLWMTFLVSMLAILGIRSAVSGADSACLPDGTFSMSPDSYSLWSSPGFFEVTLGIGNLTFTQAKVIDIAWDIVVGRGGQFVLAYILFLVLREYISSSMQSYPVSFAMYKHTFLTSEPSVLSTTQLMREFIFRRGLNSKIAMTWLIFSSLFVMAYPTIVTAMTAYATNNKAFLMDGATNMIDFSLTQRIWYTIQDGSRINTANGATQNLTDNYHLTTSWNAEEPWSSSWQNEIWDGSDCARRTSSKLAECLLWSNTTFHLWYANRNWTVLRHPEGIKFLGLNVTAEPLNITDGTTILETPGILQEQATYLMGNQTYTRDGIMGQKHLGKCQPMGTYKWGFSFLMLYPLLIVLLIWSLGTWIMWIKAHLALQAQKKAIAGKYKAVLCLAAAIREQSGEIKYGIDEMNEEELCNHIIKEMDGGVILDDSNASKEKSSMWRAFIGKRSWWWLAFGSATLLVIIFWPMSPFIGPLLGVFYSCMFLGLVVALIVGRSDESRLAVMGPSLVFSLIIATRSLYG